MAQALYVTESETLATLGVVSRRQYQAYASASSGDLLPRRKRYLRGINPLRR